MESNPIFREDRVCQELIVEALKYHLLPERRSTLQSPRTRPRKSTVRNPLTFCLIHIVNFLKSFVGRSVRYTSLEEWTLQPKDQLR